MEVRHRLMLAGACLVFVGACGSADAGVDALAAPQADLVAAKNGESPLGAFVETPEQRSTLTRARAALVVTCMKDFGFAGFTTQEAGARADASESAGLPLFTGRRYLYIPPQEAARNGYGLDPAVLAAMPKSGKDKPTPLPDDVQRVLTGDGGGRYKGKKIAPGGCAGATDATLRKNAPRADEFLPWKLMAEASGLAEQDERVRAVVNAWSACMRAKGFDYRTPEDAWNDPRWVRDPAAPPSDAERAAAVADMECKDQVGYVLTRSTAQNEYENKLAGEHADELRTYRESREILVRNAETVLKGGRP